MKKKWLGSSGGASKCAKLCWAVWVQEVVAHIEREKNLWCILLAFAVMSILWSMELDFEFGHE